MNSDKPEAGWPSPITKIEEVGAMTTRIAHDLNELLAPLLGNAGILEEEIPSTHPLRDCVESLRKVIDDARSFAQRLMAIDVRRKLVLEPAELAKVVRASLPSLRRVLGPGIEVKLSVGAGAGKARLDRAQVEQALIELAQNAREAMPAGGSFDIELSGVEGGSPHSRLPSGDWLCLRVRDSGCGMDQSLLERAFEPLVSTKVAGRGAGLGLAVVYAIVRQHGGLVDVESQPGKGSTFSIYLPSAGGADANVGATSSAADSTAANATLLLVEDNPMVRRSVDANLRAMGYRVIAVGSGEQCLEMLKTADFCVDLLITDVVMPEMNGRQLIERVHVMRPGLPVLFMSGYDCSNLPSRKPPATVEHFLQKPFDSQELAEAVRSAIARPAPGAA